MRGVLICPCCRKILLNTMITQQLYCDKCGVGFVESGYNLSDWNALSKSDQMETISNAVNAGTAGLLSAEEYLTSNQKKSGRDKKYNAIKKQNRIANIILAITSCLVLLCFIWPDQSYHNGVNTTLLFLFVMFVLSAGFKIYVAVKRGDLSSNSQNQLAYAWENKRISLEKRYNKLSNDLNKYDSVESNEKDIWFNNDMIIISERWIDFYRRCLTKPFVECNISYSTIAVDDIQCYYKEGDIQYTSMVSGGGGGGFSVSGAIIGGLVAGDAGMIVGSRKKIDPIQTSIQTHDSRDTVIRYYNNGSLSVMKFPGFVVYDYLLRRIPEKDYISISMNNM